MPDDAPGFVPDDFTAPECLEAAGFYLEPLGPQHNDADYRAWTTSMDHIQQTPGFAGRGWPHPMTLAENRADLEGHAAEFAARSAFTYTVLDPQTRDVIGCLYIYPAKDAAHDADVSSWVRADQASRDASLRAVVRDWLRSDWPFRSPHYDG